MSRVIGIPSAAAWAGRAHRFSLATLLQRLLVLGFLVLSLVWLICIGILIHDMVSWWAEFAVWPLSAATEGPSPGW